MDRSPTGSMREPRRSAFPMSYPQFESIAPRAFTPTLISVSWRAVKTIAASPHPATIRMFSRYGFWRCRPGRWWLSLPLAFIMAIGGGGPGAGYDSCATAAWHCRRPAHAPLHHQPAGAFMSRAAPADQDRARDRAGGHTAVDRSWYSPGSAKEAARKLFDAAKGGLQRGSACRETRPGCGG